MNALAELTNRGVVWRSRLDNLDFIGEIELEEGEVDGICSVAGKFIQSAWNEDFRIALTVGVVNLAYYTPDEDQNSFRWIVLDKMGIERDTQIWEQYVGYPILRVLEKYFREKDVPGANRYVRPIMRQAGVPARLTHQFSLFFLQLVQSLGWAFSQSDYYAFCKDYTFKSSVLDNFLPMPVGWRYCSDIARIVRRQTQGILSDQNTSKLSPRFKSAVQTISGLLDGSATRSVRGERHPSPSLAIDLSCSRLAIKFSEAGLNGAYRWSDGTRVTSSLYHLKDSDFDALRGEVRQSTGGIEMWDVTPWLPSGRSWAAFRATDGTVSVFRQSSGLLSAGSHILAIPEEVYDTIKQLQGYSEYVDYGRLFHPGPSDAAIRVVQCELAPGLTVPSIGLSVESGPAYQMPFLRFAENPHTLVNCYNVFVNELPAVEIGSWNPQFSDDYVLILESGTHRKVVDERLYTDDDSFRLTVNRPAQGRLLLEPKARTPKGFNESELKFVLLPEARIDWPELLYEASETPIVAFQPAARFRVEWQQPDVKRISENSWQVPRNIDFLEAQVVYDSVITFPVAGRIDRFRLEGLSIEGDLVCLGKLRQRTPLSLFLSRHEQGRLVELGLVDGRGFTQITTLGPVSASGLLSISTDDILDSFDTSACPAGRIAIRLPSHRVVSSSATFLHEFEIARRVLTDDEEQFRSWSAFLPEALRSALEALRQMRTEPVSVALLSIDPPLVLRQLLESYQACSRVFDFGEDCDASEPLSGLLVWYLVVKRYLNENSGYDPNKALALLAGRPRNTSILPRVTRWRTDFARSMRDLRRLRSLRHLHSCIREWSEHCRAQHWSKAKSSRFGQMIGGVALTEAATCYFDGMARRLDCRTEVATNYLIGSKVRLDEARQQSRQGLVWEVASALRAMIFFELGHDQFDKEANALIDGLGDHWYRLKLDIQKLRGVATSEEHDSDTLGLDDILPYRRSLENRWRTSNE